MAGPRRALPPEEVTPRPPDPPPAPWKAPFERLPRAWSLAKSGVMAQTAWSLPFKFNDRQNLSQKKSVCQGQRSRVRKKQNLRHQETWTAKGVRGALSISKVFL